jgi:thiamine-phosphate pyrophosphorylase
MPCSLFTALTRSRLYAICDLGYLTKEQALPVSRSLLEGGAGILQLRAKGHQPDSLLSLAVQLRALCEEFSVPFIVNDHAQLAVESHAHGLHLGQDDGSLEAARNAVASNVIVGRSTHSLEQANKALAEGADYIGFGPLFPTPTKLGRPGIGLGDISAMDNQVGCKIPAFCIGGIKPDNLPAVLDAGARRVVIVSHLLTHSYPADATRSVISQIPIL